MSRTRRILASCLGIVFAMLLAAFAPSSQPTPTAQFQNVTQITPIVQAPVSTTTPSAIPEVLSTLNALPSQPTVQVEEPPAPADCLYTVPQGSSLSKSANAIGNGMTWQRLHELNPQIGPNPNNVRAGQQLRCDEITAIPAAIAPVSPEPARDISDTIAPTSDRVRIWDRLAECESTSRWNVNTGNGYYGGLQFSQNSWEFVGGTGRPHEASKEVQIEMAERLLSKQGWNAWPKCSYEQGLRNEPAREDIPVRTVAAAVETDTDVEVSAASADWVHPFPELARCSSGYHSDRRPDHNGIDMSNRAIGSPVLAIASGVVRKSGPANGYGQVVVIEHDGIFAEYGHVRAGSLAVNAGDTVVAGQQIAEVGNEGTSTGPHLHFELATSFFGSSINPTPFMRDRGVTLCPSA